MEPWNEFDVFFLMIIPCFSVTLGYTILVVAENLWSRRASRAVEWV